VIKQLVDSNLVQHVCSQNVDGFHRKTGLASPHQLSELHGNTNVEFCIRCKSEYLREFRCRRSGNHVHDHRTGRMCEKEGCGGALHDSIINFGEDLPQKHFKAASAAFAAAELVIVLGSSCRVSPAADLPEQVGLRGKLRNGPKLVIVNLQVTPLDELAAVKVHAKTDVFLAKMAAELGVVVPEQVVAVEEEWAGRKEGKRQNGPLRQGSSDAVSD